MIDDKSEVGQLLMVKCRRVAVEVSKASRSDILIMQMGRAGRGRAAAPPPHLAVYVSRIVVHSYTNNGCCHISRYAAPATLPSALRE